MKPSWRGTLALLSEHRYYVLSGVLVLVVIGYLAKGRWGGAIDIWEHAAAARELGAHPLDPKNHALALDAPSQLYSPYHLAIGLVSRILGVSIVTAVNLAALFNVVLLLVGLRLFVSRLLPGKKHVDFYALLFMLFLWGPGAWFYSGFIHFDVFGLVLAYPATFAKGAVFIALVAHMHYLERNDYRWLGVVGVISTVLFLAHPVDAVFLAIAVAALAFTWKIEGRRDRKIAITVLAIGMSFLLAMLWPYFSLRELLFGDQAAGFRDVLTGAERSTYEHVLTRIFPALIVLPFVVRRLWSSRQDPLLWMFAGALAAYGYGYWTENWSYGRLISSTQIVAAIILADERATAAEVAHSLGDRGRPVLRWLQATTGALVLLGMYNLRNGFVILPDRIVADRPYNWVHNYVDMVETSDFAFLEQNHRTYPMVISDVYTALEVPVFGSKVVAFARRQAFVDNAEGAADVNTFYSPQTSDAERRHIIQKHGVSLLLVPTAMLNAEPTRYQPLVAMGRVVSANQRFLFVDLRQAP